jgi:hypothetical protein
MRCLSCGSDGELFATVTITKYVPMADRLGTIKIGGLKLGQVDAKEAWDSVQAAEGLVDKMIRGPIVCAVCQTEHYYVVGSKRPLRIGSYAEACEKGHEALMGE